MGLTKNLKLTKNYKTHTRFRSVLCSKLTNAVTDWGRSPSKSHGIIANGLHI